MEPTSHGDINSAAVWVILDVVWMLYGCVDVVWMLYGCCMDVVWMLYGSCMDVV